MALTWIAVAGTIKTADQVAAAGTVQFLTPELRDTAGDVVLASSRLSVRLNSSGEFTIELPAGDSVGVQPAGTAIEVRIILDRPGVSPPPYFIQLAAAGPNPVQLADLAPATPSVSYSTYATVAQLDAAITQALVDAGEYTDTAIDAITPGSIGAAAAVHQHSGADITSGTVAVGRLPTGTSGTTVALGNHTHTAAAVGADPAGTATAAVDAHVAATDPHGDRAFATAGLAGKADLVGGVVPTAQIPAIAITEYLGTSANQAAMLAKSGQLGDWTIRLDLGTTWVITGADPTQLASWTALSYPTAPVLSVAGKTGVVTLVKGDVGLPSVADLAPADLPVSTAQQAALDLKANANAVIPLSLATTKGQLFVATGAGAVVAVGVGTDGQQLTADPNAASGVVWRAADPDQLPASVGIVVPNRWFAASASAPVTTSGTIRFTCFTSPYSITISKMAMTTGSTAAGATPTLCRYGLWSIDLTTGAATLVASTANDTTMFNGTAQRNERPFTTPYALVAGLRYAYAPIIVTGAALPTFVGQSINGAVDQAARLPRATGQLAGQADLPASVANGSFLVSNSALQAELLV